MTLEELLDCDAAKLESFTTEQLTAWFEPMFPTTRPERASTAVARAEKNLAKTNPKLLQGMKLAAQLGIDLGDSLTNRKKK